MNDTTSGDSQPFWRQSPADDPAPEASQDAAPPPATGDDAEPPETVTIGDKQYVVFPKERLNNLPGIKMRDLLDAAEKSLIPYANPIDGIEKTMLSAAALPLPNISGLDSPMAKLAMGINESILEHMAETINPAAQLAQLFKPYDLGSKLADINSTILHASGIGLSLTDMMPPASGLFNWTSLLDKWDATVKANAARDRRNRDRAPQFLSAQHIEGIIENIDFEAFLNAQNDDDKDTTNDDAQLIAQLRTMLRDLAYIELRKDIARELLYIAWVSVARQWGFDGDDSIEYEFENEETGEPQTYTATGEDVTDILFEDLARGPDGWRDFSAQYIERDILAGFIDRALREYAPPPPQNTAFNPDGMGYTDASTFASGAQLSLVAQWPGPRDEHPVFTYTNAAGTAYYTPSPDIFPNVESAWEIVNQLSDAHADIFDYILCKYIANRHSARGPYGGIYVSGDEFLDARAIKKHVNGGHKPENIEALAKQIRELSQLNITGQITGYTKPQPGKRRRQETLTIEAPLIVVSHTVKRKELPPGGKETTVAWYVRPGDWAAALDQLSEQYAITMQSILRLHAKDDAYAKRIARYLITQYRIRAYEGNWKQPYKVSTLLAGSGITIDRNNQRRFRRNVEAAIDNLNNPDYMPMGQICIANWEYTKTIEPNGRGWLDRWLDSGIIIIPPETLTAPYKPITARRARQTSRKLTG